MIYYYVEVLRAGQWTLVGQYGDRSQADLIAADYCRGGETVRVTDDTVRVETDETDEEAFRRQEAIRLAAVKLGIPPGTYIRLVGYGAHPRAAEILAILILSSKDE